MNTSIYHEAKDDMVKIPIALIEDETLSSRAKFIYILILAMKDDEPNMGKLPKLSGLNRGTVLKYLKELELAGWIERKTIRDERKRIAGVEYVIHYEKA
jgi:DNA-binding MarR family transcriptional regulator